MSTNPPSPPVGSVLAWCGSNTMIPEGWLYCDGTLLEQSQYPQLYNAIGHSFGNPAPSDNYDPNTQFFLPDFRGYFLRGVDGGTGRDPDSTSRIDMQAPSNQYSGVGSVQLDQFRQHTHGYQKVVFDQGEGIKDGNDSDLSSASTDSTGGNETRPINAYVFYIILAEN